MDSILFQYRSRSVRAEDIDFINDLIVRYQAKGRSHISRLLCEAWSWRQPNGNPKEYAARDLLLRLEEQGVINLPPRQRPKNNNAIKTYAQPPLFLDDRPLCGSISDYLSPELRLITKASSELWNYLVFHHHYLGLPKMVGEYLRYEVLLNGRTVACLGWASAAWKIVDRDRFIGWDHETRKRNLPFVVNNVRFLIPPWVRIEHLASKILAMNLRRLSRDWEETFGHPVYLAETFVDLSRYCGTCYRAANWKHVGQTKGSAKRGNAYIHHGQPKAIYLYPLHRNFKRLLCHDQG